MEEYLNCFRYSENIYYLNTKGRERVDSKKIRNKTGNVTHFLMRNTLYIAYKCPSTWRNEIRIQSKGATSKDAITVVPDALFKMEERWHFVEVDHIQKMQKNEGKLTRYRKLIERNAFGHIPKFIWITTTEYRRKRLKELCKGLDCDIWTTADFNF